MSSPLSDALKSCRGAYSYNPDIRFVIEPGESSTHPGRLRFCFAVESRPSGTNGPLRRKGRLYLPVGCVVPTGEMFLKVGKHLSALDLWAPPGWWNRAAS